MSCVGVWSETRLSVIKNAISKQLWRKSINWGELVNWLLLNKYTEIEIHIKVAKGRVYDKLSVQILTSIVQYKARNLENHSPISWSDVVSFPNVFESPPPLSVVTNDRASSRIRLREDVHSCRSRRKSPASSGQGCLQSVCGPSKTGEADERPDGRRNHPDPASRHSL